MEFRQRLFLLLTDKFVIKIPLAIWRLDSNTCWTSYDYVYRFNWNFFIRKITWKMVATCKKILNSWMLCTDWAWSWLRCCKFINNSYTRQKNRWICLKYTMYLGYKVLAGWYGKNSQSCLCFCQTYHSKWWRSN